MAVDFARVAVGMCKKGAGRRWQYEYMLSAGLVMSDEVRIESGIS